VRAHAIAVVLGRSISGDMMPPPQYRSTVRTIIITTTSQAEVDRVCGKPEEPKRNMACAKFTPGREPYIVIPNPCRFAERFPSSESYAALMCHELAHVQGWRHKK
jgi:hypothetical protein